MILREKRLSTGVKCVKYTKFEKPKISSIWNKTFILSTFYVKCDNIKDQVFKEEEIYQNNRNS